MTFRDKIPRPHVKKEILDCGEVGVSKIVESSFIQADLEKKCWNLVYFSVLNSLFQEPIN